MKNLVTLLFVLLCLSCSQEKNKKTKILFLHHSTGECVWKGNYKASFIDRVYSKITGDKSNAKIPSLIKEINSKALNALSIEEQIFPKATPYGWKNYPFDYYNLWVKNAGDKPYMDEPTLEMLTKKYQVIIFKHCFPGSTIEAGSDTGTIDSEVKTLANYKLQYLALRKKMLEFPQTKFIVWTLSSLVKNNTNEDQALRAKKFCEWVINEWDQPNDNIFLWDFNQLETEGGLYMKDDYAQNANDSHPNPEFSDRVASLFVNRIVDVIETGGLKTNLKGEKN
jgi:hypothetical protein